MYKINGFIVSTISLIDIPVYRARNQLAALDHNHHKDRAHATTADGQPR